MPEKLTGYFLLLLGLIIMLVSAYQVYQVFTGALLPLSISHSAGLSLTVSPELPTTQLIPAQEIDQLTNLALTYLLLTFFVSLGYKLSSLGVQLLRTIEVKLGAKQT